MIDSIDVELLADYTRESSENAFAELVRRHINLVYSTAYRHVGRPTQAEEITQAVFVVLAAKATTLRPETNLDAWLYETTRLTSLTFLRSERRRQSREQEAYMQSNLQQSPETSVWDQLSPLLDEAIARLERKDREAVVLRYFKEKSVRDIAAAMKISEAAAQSRVHRATEKLRKFFLTKGVSASTAVLVGTISANAVQTAPVALTGTITATAITYGVGVSGSTIPLAKGVLNLMAWTKAKIATIGVCVVVGIATPFVIQHRSNLKWREELRQQTDQLAALRMENRRLAEHLRKLTATPRLPVPQIRHAASPTNSPAASTNLISQMFNGKNPSKLTAEQIESYLKENQRNAASLIAAFRATGDQNLLQEAMKNFPGDPLVNFAAIFNKDFSPEKRRQQLDALKHAAPENALADFVSALDYFNSGETDQAVHELIDAYGKTEFQDFTRDLIQNSEEAYLAAGYSVADAKLLATSQVLLPHLAELKQLSEYIVNLANSYRQAGDWDSAEASLQIAANLGRRFHGAPGEPLVSHLVGLMIERNALKAMDPSSPYGSNGLKVSDRLEQVTQQSEQLNLLAQQFGKVQHRVTPQDWISYTDRWRTFGEYAASQWLVNKYRDK